jgi:hypothetical protein
MMGVDTFCLESNGVVAVGREDEDRPELDGAGVLDGKTITEDSTLLGALVWRCRTGRSAFLTAALRQSRSLHFCLMGVSSGCERGRCN